MDPKNFSVQDIFGENSPVRIFAEKCGEMTITINVNVSEKNQEGAKKSPPDKGPSKK